MKHCTQDGRPTMLILCLYVDNLLVTGSNKKEIEEFKIIMKNEFYMSALGKLTYFLGMEFTETKEGLVMQQKKYVDEILRRYNMTSCNPAVTQVEVNAKLGKEVEEELANTTLFKQVVGSIRYLCNIIPDLCYSVGVISRFMENPKHNRWIAAKRVMRYILGTLEHGILFAKKLKQGDGIWLVVQILIGVRTKVIEESHQAMSSNS
uniref:Uncharacterized protein LOC113785818 n=1 Tax=Cicer arietinum TaxID=3827 RepID=A0A3Q7YDX8_CICAR|nr:uncharacterized protein LOC113785818 [Cicer arietinum]